MQQNREKRLTSHVCHIPALFQCECALATDVTPCAKIRRKPTYFSCRSIVRNNSSIRTTIVPCYINYNQLWAKKTKFSSEFIHYLAWQCSCAYRQTMTNAFSWGWEVLCHFPYSPDKKHWPSIATLVVEAVTYILISPKIIEPNRGNIFHAVPEILLVVDHSIRRIHFKFNWVCFLEILYSFIWSQYETIHFYKI